MAGMTRLTGMIIQSRGDDIVCAAGGPSRENGKFCGWIELYRNGEYDHALLSSPAIYDSEEVAIKEMENIVTKVRSIGL